MNERKLVLDIGGEGRYSYAMNLNPSSAKTFGSDRGAPIPRLIHGRADAIPLPDQCVDVIVVERTPLRADSLHEIRRVIRPEGMIILRHTVPPISDPHRIACQLLAGCVSQRKYRRSGRWMQETIFRHRGNQPLDSSNDVRQQSYVS